MQLTPDELTLLQMACEFFTAHTDHGERDSSLALDNNTAMLELTERLKIEFEKSQS